MIFTTIDKVWATVKSSVDAREAFQKTFIKNLKNIETSNKLLRLSFAAMIINLIFNGDVKFNVITFGMMGLFFTYNYYVLSCMSYNNMKLSEYIVINTTDADLSQVDKYMKKVTRNEIADSDYKVQNVNVVQLSYLRATLNRVESTVKINTNFTHTFVYSMVSLMMTSIPLIVAGLMLSAFYFFWP